MAKEEYGLWIDQVCVREVISALKISGCCGAKFPVRKVADGVVAILAFEDAASRFPGELQADKLKREILLAVGLPLLIESLMLQVWRPAKVKELLHQAHPRAMQTPHQLALQDVFADTVPGEFALQKKLSWQLYLPMLLLSADPYPLDIVDSTTRHRLFQRLAHHIAKDRITHIALEAPIPRISDSALYVASTPQANYLRIPAPIQPLMGDFGSLVSGIPSADDLAKAFYTSSIQHGLTQVWAPRYTMFSKGNVTEKGRVQHLRSLQPPFLDPLNTTAVDLYAGIGYFAFAYAYNVAKVLCWELNPWSCEGFRRGAAANGWRIAHHSAGEKYSAAESIEGQRAEFTEAKLLLFHEDNRHAIARVQSLRSLIPPVRHVNCGLLPSSSTVWADAAAILDPRLGGWIHVHENVRATKPEHLVTRGEDILRTIEQLENCQGRSVSCEHVERVKSYAPKVWHCVFDIHIGEMQA